MEKSQIGIVVSSIREGRFADEPARWIFDIATGRDDLDFEFVDLRDCPLPLFEAAMSPIAAPPTNETALRWRRKMAGFDGCIFVTAEYNHSITGALKNALDHSYSEFNRKPAAFVGYGGVGGARAVEQLRLICIELQIAPTRTAVHIGMEPYLGVRREDKDLSEYDYLNDRAASMLDELAWWTHTLRAGRKRNA